MSTKTTSKQRLDFEGPLTICRFQEVRKSRAWGLTSPLLRGRWCRMWEEEEGQVRNFSEKSPLKGHVWGRDFKQDLKGPVSVSWSEDSEDPCSANFWLASQDCPRGRSESCRNQNNMWMCAQVGIYIRECVHRWLCTQVSVCPQTTHVNAFCRFMLWHLLWGERKANTDSLG